jgi:hypothetical protein
VDAHSFEERYGRSGAIILCVGLRQQAGGARPAIRPSNDGPRIACGLDRPEGSALGRGAIQVSGLELSRQIVPPNLPLPARNHATARSIPGQ